MKPAEQEAIAMGIDIIIRTILTTCDLYTGIQTPGSLVGAALGLLEESIEEVRRTGKDMDIMLALRLLVASAKKAEDIVNAGPQGSPTTMNKGAN